VRLSGRSGYGFIQRVELAVAPAEDGLDDLDEFVDRIRVMSLVRDELKAGDELGTMPLIEIIEPNPM